MKKIVLLVPDKMVYVKGSSGKTVKALVETTPENVVNALVMDDYHMNYYFEDRRAIQVVSVEEE